jgi:hypothetical protein
MSDDSCWRLGWIRHQGVLLAHYCGLVHKGVVGALLLLGTVVVCLEHSLCLFRKVCYSAVVKVVRIIVRVKGAA